MSDSDLVHDIDREPAHADVPVTFTVTRNRAEVRAVANPSEAKAVAGVRQHYNLRAVETPCQRRYVSRSIGSSGASTASVGQSLTGSVRAFLVLHNWPQLDEAEPGDGMLR